MIRFRTLGALVCGAIAANGAAHAQSGQLVTLRGTVIDSSHHLVRGVLVYLSTAHTFTVTDKKGRFTLAGVGRGADTLQLRGMGLAPRAFRLNLPDSARGTVDVGTVLLPPGPPPTVALLATVRDTVGHQAVVGAQVMVNDSSVGLTDSAGNFRARAIRVDWGLNMILIRRIGYTPLVRTFRVAGLNEQQTLTGVMEPHAIDLPAVVAEADRITFVWGRLREFYRRREEGQGRFFTRGDIDRRRPHFVSDLLFTVPGLSVVRRNGTSHIWSRRGAGPLGRCAPLIWVDGMRLMDGDLDSGVRPREVEAMEVYVGIEPPAQFGGAGENNGCGAILVWTR